MHEKEYLDCLTIISLPKNTQKCALALLFRGEGSAEEITKDMNHRKGLRGKKEVASALKELVKRELILNKFVNGKITYYIKNQAVARSNESRY